MRLVFVVILLCATAAPTLAVDPPPPTIDQLVEKLAETRKQQEVLAKLAADVSTQLGEALDKLNKRLAELGVTPPSPPRPPVPPPPTDPLLVSIQAAYQADPAPAATKAAQLADLAELYKQAADLAGDATVRTAAELVERVKAAAKGLKVDGLAQVRRLIAAEIATAFPEDSALTDASRANARKLFLRISEVLKGVNRG